MKRYSQVLLIVMLTTMTSMFLHSRAFANEKLATLASKAIDVSNISRADYSLYSSYLKNHAELPIDYVIHKFKSHDAVLLGEMHEIRENCEFVSQLIEPLYSKASVRVLATEFIRSRNTARVNQLVTAKEFDEDVAVQIFRDYAQPWGFKEYIDILKAVWNFNCKLPPEAEKFHVVGLDSNWSQYDIMFNLNDDAARIKVYQTREKHMIRVFEEDVLLKGHKALVYLGYGHTFPEERFGAMLQKKHGDRIFWVCLHHQLGKRFVGFLEELFAQNANKAIGFDVVGSPFANLRDNMSPYFKFLEGSVFSQLTHGYLFLKPVDKLTRITWIPGFIDTTNFENIRGIALKRQWITKDQCTTVAELDRLMKKIFESSR